MNNPDLLMDIHRAFHGMMNGPVSQSMREKGLTYKVVFGVELPRLQAYATELPHTAELAQALWKEQIRESRLLAPMLMPSETFAPEMADEWVRSMQFTEEANACVLFLFQHLPYASQKAFEWIAREEWLFQFCGFALFARLFMQNRQPELRDRDEFLDQCATALRSNRTAVRTAARNSLLKFMDLGETEFRRGDSLLADNGL